MTGYSRIDGDTGLRAFLWDGETLLNLGRLGGSSSSGIAINAAGEVAGNATTIGNTVEHAFRWSGGVMQDLGSLGGAEIQSTRSTLLGK